MAMKTGLMLETVRTSETSAHSNETTRIYILEDSYTSLQHLLEEITGLHPRAKRRNGKENRPEYGVSTHL
jgi:hypothetical protein